MFKPLIHSEESLRFLFSKNMFIQNTESRSFIYVNVFWNSVFFIQYATVRDLNRDVWIAHQHSLNWPSIHNHHYFNELKCHLLPREWVGWETSRLFFFSLFQQFWKSLWWNITPLLQMIGLICLSAVDIHITSKTLLEQSHGLNKWLHALFFFPFNFL